MSSHQSRSVLVVEDEALIACAAEMALTDSGFLVCGTAETESEALRLAADCHPRFALVDLTLRGGDSGLRVGRALAAEGISVVYATGQGPGWWQEMQDSGARGCLPKPYDPDDVPIALDALARMEAGEKAVQLPRNMHLFID